MNKQLQNVLVFTVVGAAAYLIFGRKKETFMDGAQTSSIEGFSPLPLTGSTYGGGNLVGGSNKVAEEEREHIASDAGYYQDIYGSGNTGINGGSVISQADNSQNAIMDTLGAIKRVKPVRGYDGNNSTPTTSVKNWRGIV